MTRRSNQPRGGDHVLTGFSPVYTALKLFLLLAGVYLLGVLSLGWSRGETQELTNFMVGNAYGSEMAWMIQILPQILLVLRVVVDDPRGRWLLFAAAIAFNVIDAGTNVIAISAMERAIPADWPIWSISLPIMGTIYIQAADIAMWFAYGIAIAITWAEELMAFMIGMIIHMVAMLMGAVNMRVPEFMTVGASYMRTSAGGRVGVNYGE